MPKTAVRHLTVRLAALNLEDDSAPKGTLEGYASIYNKPYMGEFGPQMVAKNAFAEDIADKNGVIPIFYQHGWAKASNSVPIGYATVKEDAKGLKVQAQLFINEMPEAMSVWLASAAGALREWSIGFLAKEVTMLDSKGKPLLNLSAAGMDSIERTDKGELLESSVVVKGANPWTTMTRAAEAPVGGLPEEEEASTIAEIKALLGKLLAAEVNEMNEGDGGVRPIQALISVLQELGWYERVDAADDGDSVDVGYVYDEAAQDRAWSLAASSAGRAMLRELCQNDTVNETNEVETES